MDSAGVDAAVQLASFHGEIIARNKAGEEHAEVLEQLSSKFATLDQLANSLKLGNLHRAILEHPQGFVSTANLGNGLLSTAEGSTFDRVDVALEIATATARSLR